MQLNLGLIIDSLKSSTPQYIFGSPDEAMNLVGVYPYVPKTDASDLDILYLAEWEQLTDGSYPKNIVCIGGGDKARELFEAREATGVIYADGSEPFPILREIQEIFIKYDRLERELYDSTLADASTRTILNHCAKFFECQMMLFDTEFRLIDYSDNYMPPDDDMPWKETLAQRKSSLKMISREHVKMLPNRPDKFPYSTFIEGNEDVPSHFNIAFDYGDSRFATLIFMETHRPFSLHQHWIADYVANIIRPLITARYNTSLGIRNYFRSTIGTMLRHGNMDSPLTESNLAKLNWRMDDDYQIVLVALPPECQNNSHYLYNYENVFADAYADCIALHFNVFIFILLHNSACSLIRQCVCTLEKQLTLDDGICSIGSLFSDFSQLTQQYSLALLPLRLYPNNGRVRYYSEIMPTHIINELNSAFPLRPVCHHTAVRLHKYDLANGTSYLLTLETYLAHNRSLATAANKLFIHRSTMTYRLKCIEKIAPMSLDDPWERLGILLSCIVLRILE